jgi:hypothetical protein
MDLVGRSKLRHILRMDGKLGKCLYPGTVFTERVLDDAEIELGNDDILPAIADPDIEQGDNLFS